MLVITHHKFLPDKLKITSWATLEPYFTQLLERNITNKAELELWLKHRSELEAFVSENLAWRYVKMTCDTNNKDLEKAYLFFVTEIEPKISPFNDKLNRKLIDCPFTNELDKDKYFVYLRGIRKELEIFREENVPIFAEIQTESQKYGAIVGSMMVEVDGKELTLQQASNYLKNTDRKKREEVYRKIMNKRLNHSKELDDLFDRLVKLRHRVAVNAGFSNFRDYMFAALGRFDYTPEDCFAFHDSVRDAVLPLCKEINERRKTELGYSELRPWDMDVDTKGRTPLEPFTSGKDLLDKTIKCFNKIDPYFAWCIETMDEMNRLDLESRKGKAPGGYNYPMSETNVPFIFMNAASSVRDVETMVHEGGHAVHSFLSKDLELAAFKNCPSEVAELASMSMELLSHEGQDAFYQNKEEFNRAMQEHLEGIIKVLPWIATIDKFQHWIYTHPTHTATERKKAWVDIHNEFSTGLVNYSGLEENLAYSWQKQLHLFEVPFYYIEYGIAQLGAISIWKNFKQDRAKAVNSYKEALSLGYTKPMKEIYETADIRFDFSRNYIESLMQFVTTELKRLL
jgi:oligoendopeptidase F